MDRSCASSWSNRVRRRRLAGSLRSLANLWRGRMPGVVEAINSSDDGRWVAVGTRKHTGGTRALEGRLQNGSPLRCGPANTRYRSARLPPIWGALLYHSLGRGCPCTAALGVDIPGVDDGMQICSGDGNNMNDACADLLGRCGRCGSS